MEKLLIAPKAALDKINEFINLPLGGKSITCPYFINKRKLRAGLRVLIGKGDPEDIVTEVKVWAKVKHFNLNKASPTEIREFMLERDIGSDCSGFLVHILNAWLKSQKAGLLINYLRFMENDIFSRIRRWLRSVENIGADLLTNTLNTNIIVDLDSIQPGDLIRSKGLERNAHHVLLVIEVAKVAERVKSFTYTHSTKNYWKNNGVRKGKVEIIDINKGLKDQKWLEVEDGENYTLRGFLNNYQDNGLRRLKWINLDYQVL